MSEERRKGEFSFFGRKYNGLVNESIPRFIRMVIALFFLDSIFNYFERGTPEIGTSRFNGKNSFPIS